MNPKQAARTDRSSWIALIAWPDLEEVWFGNVDAISRQEAKTLLRDKMAKCLPDHYHLVQVRRGRIGVEFFD